MKRKVLILTVLLSLIFMGVVSAASLWGNYKGNQVIRLTVDGVPVKVSDVPAVSLNGRTMIPIYLLKEAGINYSWDQKNQTVNIIGAAKAAPDQPPEQPKLTLKEIYKQSVGVGYVEGLDANGNVECSGSGVYVAPGFFVTNEHVAYCGKSGRITVKIDGDTYDNRAEGWYHFINKDTDLFGFGISKTYDETGAATGKTPSTYFNLVDKGLPEIGDKVYSIGSPYGLENTVNECSVSGIRKLDGMSYIQHTCSTTHGSSGGALMDEYGFLIGITSSGFDGTNLNFAIPISYLIAEINKKQNE